MTDQIEMFWKCSACGTINGGLSKKCGERIVKNGRVVLGASGGCGKAQDREEWFMPEDISKHANLTNANDIKQAKAGADWYCGYCGSTQRRLDGECANCGGNKGFAKEDRNGKIEFIDEWSAVNKNYARTSTAQPRKDNFSWEEDYNSSINRRHKKAVATGVGIGAVALLLVTLIVWLLVPRYVDATVQSVYWQSTVKVERYQIIHDEGWDTPGDAFNVQDRGRKIHHYDKVAVGTRQVPFQESYSCGQSCTTVSVPRVCTSNKNGTASCTGGGTRQSCYPKTCTRTAYRTETIYEDQPRYRNWYAWEAWRWRHNRNITRSGNDLKPRLPAREKIGLNRYCSGGQKERSSSSWEYITTFSTDKKQYKYKPKNENEFKSLPVGTRKTLKITAVGISISEDS